MKLEFHMLEGRKECVPGFEDSSAGHTLFKTGTMKLRVRAPSSGAFDELNDPYDRELWADFIVDEIKKDAQLLRYAVIDLLKQAEKHCEEHHQDVKRLYGKKGGT